MEVDRREHDVVSLTTIRNLRQDSIYTVRMVSQSCAVWTSPSPNNLTGHGKLEIAAGTDMLRDIYVVLIHPTETRTVNSFGCQYATGFACATIAGSGGILITCGLES